MSRTPEQIRKKLAAELESIRGQRDLSPEGKQRRIAKAYLGANTEMQQAKRDGQASAERRVDELRRTLFGSTAEADPAAAISFRDALERAERVRTPQQAARLLQRAHETGDTALGKAVAMQVLEHAPTGGAWASLISEWAELNGHSDALGEIAELTARDPMSRLQQSLEHSLSVPTELGNGGHVRSLAAKADEVADTGDGDVA